MGDAMVDNRFVFDMPDFDPTTAFILLDDGIGSAMPSIDVDDVIAYAKKYIGRPYSRGSKGPKAFDCSGFTSFVFRNFDISLSASSQAQSTQGDKISRTDIQPGDLLFFKGRSSSGVGHVAIAVDVDATGNVSFIHASTSHGVRIDKISDPYYSKRYLSARRVIK